MTAKWDACAEPFIGVCAERRLGGLQNDFFEIGIKMAQKIVFWTTKSADCQTLPPFQVSCELDNARFSVDAIQIPDRVVFEMDNVPMSESMVNFFKKFAKIDNSNEMVIDMDEMKGVDFFPSLLRALLEFLLKSTSLDKKEVTTTSDVTSDES